MVFLCYYGHLPPYCNHLSRIKGIKIKAMNQKISKILVKCLGGGEGGGANKYRF